MGAIGRDRLVLSPLWLLVAFTAVLGLNASSAAATGGPETRVRALDHPAAALVAVHNTESPASVGCLRPALADSVSGSCVATNNADNLARSSEILRDAARGKGNFGLGSASTAQADELGRHAWVGPCYRAASDGKTLISADGLRQYRPPSYKPNLGRMQANFETRYQPEGAWQANGHLDVTP